MHPTRLSALVHCRCPRCREGDLFERPAYRLDAFYKMYPQCMHCGQDYQIEPGFYMGASYIGYGFTAMISVVGALLYMGFFPQLNPWIVIAGILGVIALLLPLIFRYGRTFMLHLLGGVGYDPHFERKGLYVGEDGALKENESAD